jgi:signal transduction histidine kinase
MICHYFDEPAFFFFTTDLPALLYYSHIPTTVAALMIGLFVFLNNRGSLLSRLLLLLTLLFSGWTVINLLAWTNIHSDYLMFIWPFFGVFSALISILSIYFIYVFIYKKDISVKIKSVFIALLAPVFLLAHTNFSVSGFNISACDAFGFEGLWFNAYYTFLGILAMVWILILLLRAYNQSEVAMKKQIVLMGAGIELFLFSFFTILFLSSYLANIGVVEDSRLEFFGLFGMVVFVVFMGVLIVRFKSFNVGSTVSKFLVLGLLILTGSQFTYISNTVGTVLASITLVFTALASLLLVRSVDKEIAQRKEIEQLVISLDKANVRLKELDKQKSEFVSIASHQLRSPLTAIRGYASLLLEGSYGRIPKKAMNALERISTSSKLMALGIEDYLNVSRIESGNMKYNLTDFNLRDEVEHLCDDLRPEALKSGLVLLFRTDLTSRGIIHADLGKSVQIVQNLINNSVKYTKKGTIRVFVRDDVVRKKIYVDIVDTGIGMNEKTLQTIFQKFERADNANSVNIHGTGLGLYVALKMAQAMGGDVTAYSEGDNAGSRFTVELPLAL